MLAPVTDGAARAIIHNEDTENGFEIWRRFCTNKLALPERARPPNLLNETIGFRLRNDRFESDLSEFMILNRHEKMTGRPLDDDLLVTLLMQKTAGSLQQHLRAASISMSSLKFAPEYTELPVNERVRPTKTGRLSLSGIRISWHWQIPGRMIPRIGTLSINSLASGLYQLPGQPSHFSNSP